jgi:hypothetical protein
MGGGMGGGTSGGMGGGIGGACSCTMRTCLLRSPRWLLMLKGFVFVLQLYSGGCRPTSHEKVRVVLCH